MMQRHQDDGLIERAVRNLLEYFMNDATESIAIDVTLKILRQFYTEFGGNKDATFAQQPKQFLAHYRAAYYDGTQLSTIDKAIKMVLTYDALDNLEYKGLDVLNVVHKLFAQSRSKNWAAEKVGYIYTSPASLNNSLAVALLKQANVKIDNLDLLLERGYAYFMNLLLSELMRLNPNPGSEYELSSVQEEEPFQMLDISDATAPKSGAVGGFYNNELYIYTRTPTGSEDGALINLDSAAQAGEEVESASHEDSRASTQRLASAPLIKLF